MKKCEVRLFEKKCQQLGSGQCWVMCNDGFDGDVNSDKLMTHLGGTQDHNLVTLEFVLGPDGQYGKRCVSAISIVEAVRKEKERRRVANMSL